MTDTVINDVKAYSSDIRDIIIAIREAAKSEAKEVSVAYFNGNGEVSIKVTR